MFQFSTDTATIVIFGLSSLKHKLSSGCDWWSVDKLALVEINKKNVCFIELGTDGIYQLIIQHSVDGLEYIQDLEVIDKEIFIGAGEEVTAAGYEPKCVRGGLYYEIKEGSYQIFAKLLGACVTICFLKSGQDSKQELKEIPRLV